MSTVTIPNKGDTLVLVGTRKGVFIFSSDQNRSKWEMIAHHWAGADVFQVVYDDREGGSLMVLSNDVVFGSEIHRSYDFGATWQSSSEGPTIEADSDIKLNRFWQITPGRPDEPGVIYVGADPASLFKSVDAGNTWDEVEGVTLHPTRGTWMPGFGGMCLHSIVLDPLSKDRMAIGISAAGVFGTEDGGKTWQPLNKGVRADFMPDTFPEVGQCPHKLVSHPEKPAVLYQQNHCGVYRSENWGSEWIDISEGLPSRFGLAMAVNSQDPDTVYVLPEDKVVGDQLGGGIRYVTDAKFRVFRSRNRGDDWEPLTQGLPQKNAYLHSMRDGLATDALAPCGVYVGTTTGQLFYSRDDGDSWDVMADYLPPINSVETALMV